MPPISKSGVGTPPPPFLFHFLGLRDIKLQVYKLLPKSECRFYLGGMTLIQGRISQKYMAFSMPTGCVRFARYCGKMYSRHLFWYGAKSFEISNFSGNNCKLGKSMTATPFFYKKGFLNNRFKQLVTSSLSTCFFYLENFLKTFLDRPRCNTSFYYESILNE